MFSRAFLSLFVLLQFAVAQKCPLQFDGRVPAGSTPASFDTSTSKFNPSNVFGKGMLWSRIAIKHLISIQVSHGVKSFSSPQRLLLHSCVDSVLLIFIWYLLNYQQFDANSTISVEVTISDSSIFNSQTGFRRAELLPASNSGSDPSTQGIKTLHFSLQQDTNRPLNFSHEYQLVFLETADFSTNQFALKTGAISGHAGQGNNRLVLQSNVRNPTDLHAVSFTAGVWHNYAITLDFTAKWVFHFHNLWMIEESCPLDVFRI